jgi:UDP-GlcNAc:undecaprenyl-phosphate GlcNAc-1-phosphate transferase
MTSVYYPTLFLIAFLVSLAVSPLIRRFAFAIGAVDLPGERKIHSVPIPRVGGHVIALSFSITLCAALGVGRLNHSWAFVDLTSWWPILIGAAIVFFGGACDDVRPLPVWGKFLIQAVGAVTAIALGVRIDHVSLFGSGSVNLELLAVPLTFLWIVGITNAFNLVDGLDGLAVGLGSIAAGTCATLFLLRGDTQDAMVLFVVLGSLLGFLPHNFNPARMYLGDSGSMLIGYVLAITAVVGTQKTATAVAVFVPLLVLGLPIIDTLFSMIRRFNGYNQKQKKNWLQSLRRMFEADQAHFHHRLMALGLSHRNAVLTLYTVAIGLSVCALLSVVAEYRNAGIVILTVILATAIGIGKLDYREVDLLRIGRLLHWYDRIASNRRFFSGFLDLFLITSAYWAGFGLKFYDAQLGDQLTRWYLNAFPPVLITQFLCFYAFGLYRGVWRAMGISDLIKVALAVGAAVAASYSLVVIRNPPGGTLSFFVIDFLLLGLFAAGIRSGYRILEYSWQNSIDHGGAALIYGAGRGGQLVLRELMQNSALGLRPIGFIDDDANLLNRTISGLPVLGQSHDLPAILDNQLIMSILISSKSIEQDHMKEVVQACRERGVNILMTGLELHPLAQAFTPLDQQTLSAPPAA